MVGSRRGLFAVSHGPRTWRKVKCLRLFMPSFMFAWRKVFFLNLGVRSLIFPWRKLSCFAYVYSLWFCLKKTFVFALMFASVCFIPLAFYAKSTCLLSCLRWTQQLALSRFCLPPKLTSAKPRFFKAVRLLLTKSNTERRFIRVKAAKRDWSLVWSHTVFKLFFCL